MLEKVGNELAFLFCFLFLSFLLKKAFPAKFVELTWVNLQEVNGTVILPPLVFPELAIVNTLAPNHNPNHSFPVKLDNLKKKMLEKVGNELVFLFASIFCLSCSKKSMKEKRKWSVSCFISYIGFNGATTFRRKALTRLTFCRMTLFEND